MNGSAQMAKETSGGHTQRENEGAYHTALHTSSSQSCDGSADDKGHRVWRRAADCGTDFIQEHGCQEGVFHVEDCIHLPEHKEEGAVGKQIRSTVPADVVGRAENKKKQKNNRGYDQFVL